MPETLEQLYKQTTSAELAAENLERLAQEAEATDPTEKAPVVFQATVEIDGEQRPVQIHEETPHTEVPEEAVQSVLEALNDKLPPELRFLTENVTLEKRTNSQQALERPRSLRATRARLYGAAALIRERISDIREEQQSLNSQITDIEDGVMEEIGGNQAVSKTHPMLQERAKLVDEKKQIAENNRERLATAKAELDAIIREAQLRDEIAEQYIKGQQEITVQTQYGEVSAQSFHLTPPTETLTEETRHLPPVVLVGGWGADAAGVENMAIELAYQGREVFFVGYPDSYGGKMPLEFARATTQPGQEGLKPQAEFFIAAHTALLMQEANKGREINTVEMWGHSAGCMLGAQMLNTKQWANRVDNAMFVGPAGIAEISQMSQITGYARNITRYLRNLRSLPSDLAKHSYVTGRKATANSKNPIRQRLHQKLQKLVWNEGTLPHAREVQSDTYEHASIGSGNIFLMHGGEDFATGSATQENQTNLSNPHIVTVIVPSMNHADFIIDPAFVIEQVNRARQARQRETVQTVV